MDLQSFLQSGILEAYVLGQVTDQERAEVERMAAAHPEVRTELEAIELALEKVALANAVPPPAGLKEKVLEEIQYPYPFPSDSGAKMIAKNYRPWWAWAAAAIMLVAFAIHMFISSGERLRLNAQIEALQTQMTDCETQARQQARLQEQIALLRDRSTQTIVLSDGPEPKVTATLWHNTARQEIVLDINSLPAPSPGKYFQFWAIVEGKAVSMGMVNLRGAESLQTLPFVANAEAFAISEEDKPEGNVAPTVVVLIGKV